VVQLHSGEDGARQASGGPEDISISTVRRNEDIIPHIKNQEVADQQLDQLQLKLASS
jgi:hypothetical protein